MNDRKLAANIQGEGLEGFSNLRMAGDVVLLVFESSDALNRVKKDKCDALEKWAKIQILTPNLSRINDSFELQVRSKCFKIHVAETKPVFSPSSLFFYDEMDTSDSKRVMEDNSINEFHEGDSKARDFEDVLSSSDQSNSVVAR
ncbi:hypothetical protein V6N11_035517 [Hibiscus sabdariffa]|uniref:Uncharacterized protein n=1 Tax=Hibiscus sabdariffa TaxID=183260 RepID=A0ABR2R0N6_9ROSI